MSATDLEALDSALQRLGEDGAVLRLSETEAEQQSGYQPPTAEGLGERMIMNMGPQHPSTHGVLRLVLELDGELITRSKPVIGYLHTGMEKTGENLTFLQGPTNVTRMDYASPLFSELAFSLATEKLLDIEVPERATWIRMMMCELNRMTSHLLFQATNGMDIGAVGMMIYGWREREEVLRLLRELASGDRMVVVATHDSRILPLADNIVELVPELAQTTRPPETVELSAGDVLFEQGTMGDLIYVVSKGKVEMVRELAGGGTESLRIATHGDYFGEIGPVFHLPRSATARAKTDATVVGYTVQAFRERLGTGGVRDLIEHRPVEMD